MHDYYLALRAGLSLLWGLLLTSALSTPLQPCSILPFEKVNKLILVEAEADGKTGWFLLDTGVGELVVNEDYFVGVFEVQGRGGFTDVTGTVQESRWLELRTFQLGNIARENMLVRVARLGALEKALDRPILGLIGYDILRQAELTIHYNDQLLAICLDSEEEAASSPVAKADFHLPFQYEHHLPVVEATLGEGVKMRLGLDSGASINLLDNRATKDLKGYIQKMYKLRFSGPTAVKRIRFANVNGLALADGPAFPYWRFGFNDLSHLQRERMNIDGLLGADFFRLGVVSINFKDKRVSIWLEDSNFLMRYPDLRYLSNDLPERRRELAIRYGRPDGQIK